MQLKNEISIYKTVLDLIDVGVHVINESGKTVLYNKKMMEIEGTDIEDVLDKNILDVFRFYQGEDSTLLKVLHTSEPKLNIQQTYFNNKGLEIKTVNNTYPLFDQERIVGAVEIVRDVTKLERMMKKSSQSKKNTAHTFDFFLEKDFFPKKVIDIGKQAAKTSSSIFINGEAGTGKHILTECIHNEVYTNKKPYHILNCTSLSSIYLENTLLDTINQLEKAEGGTLVIEEIQNLSPSVQFNLLTSLTKEKKFIMICTMKEDPIDLIASGKLNKQLFYQLSELTFMIPPLRERKKYIRQITLFYLNQYNGIYQMNVRNVSDEVIQSFQEYHWPGNIRELEHIIENSMKVLENEDILQLHHLPANFLNRVSQDHHFLMQKNQDIKPFEEYIQEAEKYYIQKGLQYHQYNITKTAQALNMSRQNLQYRIRKYGIEKP
ncbi:sigma 54-interacting transcriptional regulator [Heyndrickxia sp. NPDC080065]|uniref:sigma 54-interacting transcriptional regulator n=1 Tax=Heyndrickxia sp. NPDC080065 TaxID=3390568 RepID=UPI003D067F4E